MHRRAFLTLTGGAAAVAALGAWLGCARRANPGGPTALPREGRPLLVLLVPPQAGGDGELRGEIVGGALNQGSEELLADLAARDLVCLTREQLPPGTPLSGSDLPWFAELTTEGGLVRTREFRPSKPPELPGAARWAEVSSFEQLNAEADAVIAAFSAELHAWLAAGVPPAAGARADRAAEARRRYVKSPPPGAHWAQSAGCGVHIEGVSSDGLTVACGMGMVPKAAQRFLHFYVKA